MNNCDGCQYWSEMVAQSLGGGPMRALCLNPNSPLYNTMANTGCSEYAPGRPIDDPAYVAGEGEDQC